jgi:hypothetical protein
MNALLMIGNVSFTLLSSPFSVRVQVRLVRLELDTMTS